MKQIVGIVQEWINKVNEEGRGLTPWEVDFMESITDQFETCGRLTDKQEEVLERIYANKTP